jgi:hypothetical protein
MLLVMPSSLAGEEGWEEEKPPGNENRFSHRAMIGEFLGFPEAWDD